MEAGGSKSLPGVRAAWATNIGTSAPAHGQTAVLEKNRSAEKDSAPAERAFVGRSASPHGLLSLRGVLPTGERPSVLVLCCADDVRCGQLAVYMAWTTRVPKHNNT